jgi:chromosome segregation ATPase
MSNRNITESDIDSILDVNKKAIEIHSEVGRQNENIIEDLESKEKLLEELKDKINDIMDVVRETNAAIKNKMETKVEEIEKNMFRLVAILTTIGVGTIIAFLQAFLKK